jgi:hypothetical protein
MAKSHRPTVKDDKQYGGERPLGSYAALLGVFGTAVAASGLAIRKSGRELPERIAVGDLLLLGAATHKASRLLAKDKVTSPLRAPFTEHEKPGGPGEVEERPRGTGIRLALGELLVCPYCLSQWVASGFLIGLVAAPRQTRFVASLLTAVTISDFLQVAYKAAETRGLEGSARRASTSAGSERASQGADL